MVCCDRLVIFVFLTAFANTSVNGTYAIFERSSEAGERRSRSDDLTLGSLQDLLQQQASVIQTLQSQLEAERNRGESLQDALDSVNQAVTDLKSGNADLKSELASLRSQLQSSSRAVGFSARFGHDGGQFVGIPLGQHSTLVFDQAIANIGNGYDPHTGIFTAPVSGLYTFFLTQMTADNHNLMWLSIDKNGQSLDRIYTEGGSGDTHDQGASQVVTHLQAGDKVWVRQEQGGAVRGSWFTIFTGYLIQAD